MTPEQQRAAEGVVKAAEQLLDRKQEGRPGKYTVRSEEIHDLINAVFAFRLLQ